MNRHAGPFLVGGGLLLLLFGLLAWSGALSWLGHLPGDIRINKGNTRVYFPVVSLLVISVVLNLVLWLVFSLFRR